MTAHRYWQIQVYKSNDAWVGLGRIDMRIAIGGTNVCIGGTATVAGPVRTSPGGLSTPAGVFAPYAASLEWVGQTPMGAAVTYDFGAGNAHDIVEVSIAVVSEPGFGALPNRTANEFTIAYSDDGVTFTTAWRVSQPDWTTSPVVTAKPANVARANWRIFATQLATSYMDAAEIEMRAFVGGSNVAVSGTATAATTYGGGYEASKAFDANPSTIHAGNGDVANGAWIAYAFTSPVTIQQTTYQARPDGFYGNAPVFGTLESSPDGITWLPVFPLSFDVWTHGGQVQIFTTPFPAPAPSTDFSGLSYVPEPGMTETWSWLTDVMVAHNGGEQRVALRPSPRVDMVFSFGLDDDNDFRAISKKLFGLYGQTLQMPMYQYSAKMHAAAAIGDNRLYFSRAHADVRFGEQFALYDPATETCKVLDCGVVHSDGCDLLAPLTYAIPASWIVAPLTTVRVADRSAPAMHRIAGTLQLNLAVPLPRAVAVSPATTAALTMFKGLPVLDRRPDAEGDVPYVFESNYEVLDNVVGLPRAVTSWLHPYISGARRYVIQRMFSTTDMDWWRLFADYCKGRQQPFYLPTYHDDLTVAYQPNNSSYFMTINEQNYLDVLYALPGYQYLLITTQNATYYATVVSFDYDPTSLPRLRLDIAFGAAAGDNIVEQISFVNLARLDNDAIQLTHGATTTTIDIEVKAIDK